jgi:Ca2+:H+ antiporter
LLAVVALIIPALFHVTGSNRGVAIERELELTIVLFAAFVLCFMFTLRTHKHVFTWGAHDASDLGEQPSSCSRSIVFFIVVTVFIAVMSEMLVGALDHAAEARGLTQLFVGMIFFALVSNAAKHSTAVMMAMKNKMDLAIGIAAGSSLQIALLVALIVVFSSYLFGAPLDLIFTPFEAVAVTISALVVGFIAMDGESHWMKGVMLVGEYRMLAMAFVFLPA